MTYLSESLIHSFCARALHSDVFPVPGGPVMQNMCYVESGMRNALSQNGFFKTLHSYLVALIFTLQIHVFK